MRMGAGGVPRTVLLEAVGVAYMWIFFLSNKAFFV